MSRERSIYQMQQCERRSWRSRSRWLAGFDGVYLDVERVYSGNEDYLLLLEEVKAAIGDRILSVAGSYVLPATVNEMPGLQGFKWDGAYYQAVAERMDQIVVMGYDSGMPISALYRLWLREQVRSIERRVCPNFVGGSSSLADKLPGLIPLFLSTHTRASQG